MARALSDRKPYILLLVLLTLNLILMSSRVRGSQTGSVLEETILTLSSPFLRGAAWVSRSVAGLWGAYVDLRHVKEENLRLRDEVDRLALSAQEAVENRHEVERLRRLLSLAERVQHPTLAARVVARGEAGAPRILLMDKGARDGVQVNHPVLTSRGVVGRVIEASPGIGKIQTILDPNSGVAALIQRTRVQGMVVGEGEEFCRMEFVSDLSNVEVGDVVVTSGLDQIFPKGYIIGVVSSVGEGQGLTRFIRVRPEVDFERLEEVTVLLKPEGAPGREPS